MLLLPCPFCGRRPETEFSYGGDATLRRPADPDAVSDYAWTEYVYFRGNPKGAHRELWFHAHGCGRWVEVERDTVTHEVTGSCFAAGREAAS